MTFESDLAGLIAAYYLPVLFGGGLLVLLVAWLPLVTRKSPLSLPIVCVALGCLLFSFDPISSAAPHPAEHPVLIERATELVVIIALIGAGLKIRRPVGWHSWRITWLLLAIAMPLTIAAVALVGHYMLGLGIAAAVLLGAALAPTDPVLAGDVQIEDPLSEEEDETRFALTSEAGLNDALAFPFVHLAILLAASGWGWAQAGEWFSYYIFWKLAAGLAIGWLAGKLAGWIIYRLPDNTRLSRTGDGFVALGIALTAYTATEFAHGYGFLAVFVAGLTIRNMEVDDEFNKKLHDFADETERLWMMAFLVLFGGMLVSGGLLVGIGWREILFAIIVLAVIRPIAGYISLLWVDCPRAERTIISIFGIRGMGSIYYLAYGLNHSQFENPILLWNVLAIVVAVSILLHGITVSPVMRRYERR